MESLIFKLLREKGFNDFIVRYDRIHTYINTYQQKKGYHISLDISFCRVIDLDTYFSINLDINNMILINKIEMDWREFFFHLNGVFQHIKEATK